jgi:hypothetical protein
MTAMAPLVVHVGYPKTATTTFQRHVFPQHPDLEYLGKFIPSFGYVDARMHELINGIFQCGVGSFRQTDELRLLVERIRKQTARRCVVISSESFVHPMAVDIALVAERLRNSVGSSKVLITIREQIASILSFYWMHGRFGEYLTIGPKDQHTRIRYPIPFLDWLALQKTADERNYVATLDYASVIDRYSEVFGHDNVCILLYEKLATDPGGYAEALGRFLDADVSILMGLMHGRHEFASQGRQQPWHGSKSADLACVGAQRGPFAAWGRLLGSLGGGSLLAPARKREASIVELHERYRSGNARLQQRLCLPLAEFGYSV